MLLCPCERSFGNSERILGAEHCWAFFPIWQRKGNQKVRCIDSSSPLKTVHCHPAPESGRITKMGGSLGGRSLCGSSKTIQSRIRSSNTSLGAPKMGNFCPIFLILSKTGDVSNMICFLAVCFGTIQDRHLKQLFIRKQHFLQVLTMSYSAGEEVD